MSTTDPGVPEYRTSATMWAYAVGLYHEQLREAVEAYSEARQHGGIRNTILQSPAESHYLFGNQLEKATSVMTLGTVWRMSMARYSFVLAAAQLRKCTVALEQKKVAVPQLPDRKVLKWLRDVDEHWEQVERGESLAMLRDRMPEEGPTRVVYTGKYIEIGGIDTREIASWAVDVDRVVRAQLEEAGTPVAKVDESLADFYARHPEDG
jgi:hypothetical protein